MTYKQSKISEFIDTRTGEVCAVETEKIFTKKIKPDEFYMTFIEYISPLFKLKGEATKNLLVWLCQHAEFNTGKVSLTAAERRKIQKELGISNNSITNGLRKLKELHLINGDLGSYLINPQIFWKGELQVRNELLNNHEIQLSFELTFIPK